MDESTWETGRPDETWNQQSKAAFEALKAKYLAELPNEPDWLDKPTFPAEELITLLNRLHDESEAGDGKA